MRATVSWATPRWRGLAVAGMVGALALGTAAPHLLDPTPIDDWRMVLLTCAAAAGAAAILGAFIRPGPYATIAVRGETKLGNPLRHKRQRRITIAYVGHMWEVYGLWIWLPALLVTLPGLNEGPTGLLVFFIIGVVGALGCLASGILSSHYGKRLVARGSVLLSAICALLTPLLPVIPFAVAIIILIIWSASALSDSPLLSALTGDASDPRQVGSAIALQLGIGYFLSIAGIMLVGEAASLVGWQFAFLVLALGPIASFIALRPESPQPPPHIGDN